MLSNAFSLRFRFRSPCRIINLTHDWLLHDHLGIWVFRQIPTSVCRRRICLVISQRRKLVVRISLARRMICTFIWEIFDQPFQKLNANIPIDICFQSLQPSLNEMRWWKFSKIYATLKTMTWSFKVTPFVIWDTRYKNNLITFSSNLLFFVS